MVKKTDALVAEAIGLLLGQRTSGPATARTIAAYLLEQRRSGQLDAVLRRVAMQREQRGIVEAVVVSAHELSAKNRTALAAIVQNYVPSAKDVLWHYKVDPSVIGGVRLHVAGQELDTTIQRQLSRFAQS